MRNIILCLSVCTAMYMLYGCHPYRVDVQQGNLLEASTVAKLHLGMSKNKVEDLLGTPVMIDTFNPNTLIYTYTQQINGGVMTKKLLTLEFKRGKLVQIH